MNNWVSLHTHTEMSVLDGASKIPQLVARAKELGMPALGISDHGNLFGAYRLWKECAAAGIKPIIGMEAYCAPDTRHTKAPVFWGDPSQRRDDIGGQGSASHLLLIARTGEGLRNLFKLHELSYTEGFYRKPRVDLELLSQYSAGLAATSGCAGGAIPVLLRVKPEAAGEYALKMESIFGEHFYIEVMDHGRPEDEELNSELYDLARFGGYPLLATNDSHYTLPGDADTHSALLCVQTRSTLAEPTFQFSGSGYHLRSYDEMIETGLPLAALENTMRFADGVESYDDVFKKKNRMPVFPEQDLRGECHRLLPAISVAPEYHERLEFELKVIEDAGYSDYFLVLADIVRWARDNGIMVGPARGSAGGSLVAFVAGITSVDPIRYGLLFERFLNPQRLSPPDIDIDVEPDRREDVFQYVAEKYGRDRVAQIITFGTVKAKAALKDANRVLGGTYGDGERLVSYLPREVRGRSEPLGASPGIRVKSPAVYDLGIGLEGLVRNTGKHAAAIVISPEPLGENIPVKRDVKDNILVTGFDMGTVEALGYCKIDLLGIDNLTTIRKTLEFINE